MALAPQVSRPWAPRARSVVFALALTFGVGVAWRGAPAPVTTPAADPPTLAALADLSRRLARLQEDVAQLRAEPSTPSPTPAPDYASALRRSAEVERRLQRLAAYAREVERSLARVDTALSTPAVLEQRLSTLRALGRR